LVRLTIADRRRSQRESKTYLIGSAQAIVTDTNIDGVLVIDLTGSISWPTMIALDHKLVADRARAQCSIERFYRATTMFEDGYLTRDMQAWPAGTHPCAAIVRTDQFDCQLAFNALLAVDGVCRRGFLRGQEMQAEAWAQEMALR
jgi:hypothetical protein